jgi:hypothetical protein
MNPRKAFERVLLEKSAASNLYAEDDPVEFLYDPFASYVQIGMGGEWWNGKIRGPGTYTFRHRKEQGDPAYQPVSLKVTHLRTSSEISFEVSGGFGHDGVFILKLA